MTTVLWPNRTRAIALRVKMELEGLRLPCRPRYCSVRRTYALATPKLIHFVTRRWGAYSVDTIRVVQRRERCGYIGHRHRPKELHRRAPRGRTSQQRYPDMERWLPKAEESRQSGRAPEDVTRDGNGDGRQVFLPAAFSALFCGPGACCVFPPETLPCSVSLAASPGRSSHTQPPRPRSETDIGIKHGGGVVH
ncbi:hypothetical protein GY45DRAFT_1124944 [Cubamyces sp. BRFM 1775]|nr:hypothetical protein GY45DRAFT_1124944 [Cubamyces sp. BRFM 1775]